MTAHPRYFVLTALAIAAALYPENPARVARLQAAPQVEVIAEGLFNPRGIAFAPDGRLYVAESGSGGDGNCVVIGDGATACYGETGALTRIDPTGATAPTRVVSGLPSIAAEGGFAAVGPYDVSFLGTGNAQVVLGFAADASLRAGLGAKSQLFGSLLQVSASGKWKSVADVAAVDSPLNPDGGTTDSNPYGVAALPARRIVADAGGNAIYEARANGKVRLLALFPARLVPAPPFLGLPPGTEIPMQAVPTTVTQGPDGWLYVGQLTGFPFPIGGARIFRVPPQGGEPEVYLDGFTNIIDIAFDVSGNLYVLEIASGLQPPGQLIRVAPDGTRTTLAGGLVFPGGVAIGPDGAAYVTNFGIFPGGGQVLRVHE